MEEVVEESTSPDALAVHQKVEKECGLSCFASSSIVILYFILGEQVHLISKLELIVNRKLHIKNY